MRVAAALPRLRRGARAADRPRGRTAPRGHDDRRHRRRRPRPMLVDLHAFQTSLGSTPTMLTSRECRALEPMLAPEIRCGLLRGERPLGRQPPARRRAACRRSRRSVSRSSRSAVAAVVVEADARRPAWSSRTARRRAPACVVVAAGALVGRHRRVPERRAAAGPPGQGRDPAAACAPRTMPAAGPQHPRPRQRPRGLSGAARRRRARRRCDGRGRGFDTTVRAGAVRELLRDARAIMPGDRRARAGRVDRGAAARAHPTTRPMIGAHRGRRAVRRNRALPQRHPARARHGGPGGRRDHRHGRPATATCSTSCRRNGSSGSGHRHERDLGQRRVPRARRRRHASATSSTLLTPNPDGCAVAVNDAVVPRSDWTARTLAAGDRVEVLTAVQGG